MSHKYRKKPVVIEAMQFDGQNIEAMSRRVTITLQPAQLALLDELVGIFGTTRAEALRFAFLSWSTHNIQAIGRQIDAKRDWEARGRPVTRARGA